MATPPDRRYRVDEPPWFRKLCRRGHILRIHGRPRTDKSNTYRCRRCYNYVRSLRKARMDKVSCTAVHTTLARSTGYEIDPVVVERILYGDRPAYVHGVEMFEAVRLLTAKGWSTSRTADLTGISPRTVTRYRVKIKKGIPYGQAS